MSGRQPAQVVRLPCLLKSSDRVQWLLDVDSEGRLVVRTMQPNGTWNTKARLDETTGALDAAGAITPSVVM